MDIRVAVGDIATWRDEATIVNLFGGVTRPGGATGVPVPALVRIVRNRKTAA